jgi:hypothetical protein
MPDRALTLPSAATFLLAWLWSSAIAAQSDGGESAFAWRAGDHHIHSRFSVGWNRYTDPPTAIIGGDAIYPIPMNALMAGYHGLDWIVATDHGGPNHSKVNFEQAYPELLQSRRTVPNVVQFWGMEFDTPGADHSSLIIPFTDDEAVRLQELESRFAKHEPWPADPGWDDEDRMLAALAAMRALPQPPVLTANHPSRSATDYGVYGLDTPAELRRWNDTAPNVAVGMSGAPGHQAAALNPDGSLDPDGARGGYGRYPTMGGFDQFTAKVGGFWDAMIGEGRNWWITANSDSHVHYSEGGSDFWPGEYSKTYVWAEKTHESILDGIRSGRVFVVTGDLIDSLFVTASAAGESASIGGALTAESGAQVTVTVRFTDPNVSNFGGDNPAVNRVDLILGDVHGDRSDYESNENPSTRVIARFSREDWTPVGNEPGQFEIVTQLPALPGDSYIRVRGTNGEELEPAIDPRGEDPWSDLWFYSNPIRILTD